MNSCHTCRGSRNCSDVSHSSLEGSLLPEFDPSGILRHPEKGLTSAAELQQRAGLPAVCAILSRAGLQQAQLIAQVCPAAADCSLTCCRSHCCVSACPFLVNPYEARKCQTCYTGGQQVPCCGQQRKAGFGGPACSRRAGAAGKAERTGPGRWGVPGGP